VKIELSRVNWPTRKQTVQYTVAVIVASFIVAAFLAGWDSVFGFVLNKII